MKKLRVGNAPCSWGTLEFEDTKGKQIPFDQMLNELVETGYTGTELGDWGYMPTEPAALRAELERRDLVMLGAFVPVPLKNRSAHEDGITRALKTARLLAKVASNPQPYLVLADENGSVRARTANAGRISDDLGLNPEEWKIFAQGAETIARVVREESGLRTVFHHHCAGYVETPNEIAQFLELTDPALIGLVFDTGHYAYGAGDFDVVAGLERYKERVWYMHLKNCHADIARRAREEKWDYFAALRHGLFCELGKGAVDFPALLRALEKMNYDGYVLVEQDVLPEMGSPKESARRNREYLRSIEMALG
jgi:inosose dehydratase